MTKNTTKIKILTLRLTLEEYATLQRLAGKLSLSEFSRKRILGSEYGRSYKPVSKPVALPSEQKRLLAQILGVLGKSHVFGSLKTLADAVRLGALPVTQETEAAIQKACHAIVWIKSTLMSALGIKES